LRAIAFDPDNPATAVQAGTLTLRFGHANGGTMSYSIEGITMSRPIFRQPF
jgi:hypothetical protein